MTNVTITVKCVFYRIYVCLLNERTRKDGKAEKSGSHLEKEEKQKSCKEEEKYERND